MTSEAPGNESSFTEMVRPLRDRTTEAFADPRPGDEFNEMLSYWAGVTAVTGDVVTYWRGNKAKIERGACSKAEWNEMFAYKSIPGHSMVLSTRGERPDGACEGRGCKSSGCVTGCIDRSIRDGGDSND